MVKVNLLFQMVLQHKVFDVVLFTGLGKNHKDAASIRATYPVPSACGIYYFEVKVISKGRDG